ncbi:MAG: hypothetical protein ACK4VM_20300 [Bosea sp. (in: a-proteobacteria)]
MTSRNALDAIPVEIRRAACAFHEAGHILVGWRLGRRITHAWLRPPHGVSGETCFMPYATPMRSEREADRVRAEAEVTILCGGYCGEMIYWNQAEAARWFPGEIQSHADDLAQMRIFLRFLAPADEAALQARCSRAAMAILHAPAMLAAQKALADQLIRNRRIGGEDLATIMASSA